MLYFLPFSEAELHQLVTRQLERWATKAKDRHGIALTWDPQVLALIAEDCKDRPLLWSLRRAHGLTSAIPDLIPPHVTPFFLLPARPSADAAPGWLTLSNNGYAAFPWPDCR